MRNSTGRKPMSNEINYYLRGCFEAVVVLFISGSIIQTFFADIGFTAQQIGSYTALTSIVQVVVMVLSIFFADSTRDVKGTMALLSLSPVVFGAVMLVACLADNIAVDTVYWIAMALCVLRNLLEGFNGILFFRMLYIVTAPQDFPRLEANAAISRGTVAIVASGLVSFFAMRFAFRSVMAVGFVLSMLLAIGMSLLLYTLRPRAGFSPPPPQPFRPAILKRRDFCFFYLPNLLRGICSGLVGMLAVVCLREITDDTAAVSSLATVASIATVAGAWVFRQMRRRWRTATVYALCSAAMFLLIPLLLAGRSMTVFVILYFVMYCAFITINSAGALYPSEYVPYGDIGTYTSVRLIVMTGGSAIASYTVPLLLERMPAPLLLTLCASAQLLSGLAFFYYDRKYVRGTQPAA